MPPVATEGGGGEDAASEAALGSKDTPRLRRVAQGVLSSVPSRTCNIDIAPSGFLLVVTRSAVHILNAASGFAPFLPHDIYLKNHHDVSQQLPMFHATIKSTALDEAAAANGRAVDDSADGSNDLLAVESYVTYARWAPIEIGPMKSPILAVLNSRRRLVLFLARENHVRGPWEAQAVLNVRVEGAQRGTEPISCFSWIKRPGYRDTVLLVAASTTGHMYVWSVARGSLQSADVEVKMIYSKQISQDYIYGIHPSEDDHALIALCSRKAVQLLHIDVDNENPLVEQSAAISLPGHVSLAVWQGGSLLLCTPGNAIVVSPTNRSMGVRQHRLSHSIEFQSNAFEPVVSAGWEPDRRGWRLTLRDGAMYQIPLQVAAGSRDDEIYPRTYLEPPNEAISEEQRSVERLRGLYGLKDDHNGLVFLCHDANEIASWTHLLTPRSHLGIAINFPPKHDDVIFTEHLVRSMLSVNAAATPAKDEAFVHISKLRRALVFTYEQSSSKSRISSGLVEMLQAFCHTIPNKKLEEIDHTSCAALQICVFLRRQEKDLVRLERLQEMIPLLERSIRGAALLALLRLTTSLTTNDNLSALANENSAATSLQLRVLGIAGQVCDGLTSPHPSQSPIIDSVRQLTISAFGKAQGTRFINELLSHTSKGSAVYTGEQCRACSADIPFNSSNLAGATCTGPYQHKWHRCTTTYAIMTKPRARKCIVCERETILPLDAQSALQRRLLECADRCGVCGGQWVCV